MKLFSSLTAFDTSIAAHPGKERQRRISMTAATSFLSRAVTALTALISVPLTVHYLGAERYGLWMTISSVIAFFTFADFGLGNGLVNAIADSVGRGNDSAVRRFISGGFFMLIAVSLLLILLFVILYPLISWKTIFNVTSPLAVAEAGSATAVFAICSIIAIPLSIVQRIQAGYQEGFINNVWNILGNALGLGSILVAIRLRLGLPWLILGMAAGPLIVTALNGLHLFCYRRPWLKPAWKEMDINYSKKLFHIGSSFLVLQIIYLVVFSADNIIIANALGSAKVTEYAVPQKVFGLLTMFMGVIFMPLWPAYGEAIARGDANWVKITLRKSLIVASACALAYCVICILFGPAIIKIWIGDNIRPSFFLLLGIALQTIVSSIAMPISMFLNGANIMRLQVKLSIVVAVVCILMKVAVVGTVGLPGIPWSTAITQSVFWLVPILFSLPRLFKVIFESNSNILVTKGH